MNANRLQSIVLAAFCITAVGVSATTIESSVSTDPDDVIDVPNWVPIGEDPLVDAKDEMESNAEGEPDPDAGGGSSDEGETRPSDRGERTEAVPMDGERGEPQETGANPGEELERAAEAVSARFDQGLGPGENWLDRLLDLLRRILVGLLVLAVLFVLLALAYRYGDRIRALVSRGRSGGDAGPAWPPGDPDDEVARAWLAMVRRVEADSPRSRTPGEWASAAVDAGMDPEAVDTLTRTFAEVRYGGASPTATRRQLAWANLERLRVSAAGGSA